MIRAELRIRGGYIRADLFDENISEGMTKQQAKSIMKIPEGKGSK